MKLPEPARTLYLRERRLIDDWTATAGLDTGQVALGGGSVLGAHWGHRYSDDIDVVVQGRTAYAEMLSAKEKLDRLARNHGATPLWVESIQAVRITWTNRKLKRNEKLEFFGEPESPPRYDERTIPLEGSPTRTLGTAQILWGKFDRCSRGIMAKDIFDIRHAGRYDREALAVAVNTWPAHTMRELAQTLRSDAVAIGKEIELQVCTAEPIKPGAGREIAEEAANAVERALYNTVTVGVEKGLIRVDLVNGAGVPDRIRWPADETDVEGERTGVARHLDTLGMSVVLDDATSVAGRSAGATTVWAAQSGRIIKWRRPPEALQEMARTYSGRTAGAADAARKEHIDEALAVDGANETRP